jgi:quercetin dioxygenase-like cupin family protein
MIDEKFTEATANRPQGQHKLDAPLVTIDLTKFIVQIKQEEQWKKTDRNAITVFKSFVMRVVLIALHKGAEMKQHTTTAAISIQVIEGEMIFKTDEQIITLCNGQMLVLHEGIPHSVFAKEETVFLLTLTTL